MRIPVLLLGLCTACATVVHDLPVEYVSAAPDPASALLVGHLAFADMHLQRVDDGEEFKIEPSQPDFLVELEPGVYEVISLGSYSPAVDRVTLEARAGKTLYVGSFLRGRDDGGKLIIAVKDQLPAVESALVKRYGVRVPQIEHGLAQSSLEGMKPGNEFAIQIRRSSTRVYYSIGFGYYGGYRYHHHHSGHRHHR